MCLDDATALAVLERRVPPSVAIEAEKYSEYFEDARGVVVGGTFR